MGKKRKSKLSKLDRPERAAKAQIDGSTLRCFVGGRRTPVLIKPDNFSATSLRLLNESQAEKRIVHYK